RYSSAAEAGWNVCRVQLLSSRLDRGPDYPNGHGGIRLRPISDVTAARGCHSRWGLAEQRDYLRPDGGQRLADAGDYATARAATIILDSQGPAHQRSHQWVRRPAACGYGRAGIGLEPFCSYQGG